MTGPFPDRDPRDEFPRETPLERSERIENARQLVLLDPPPKPPRRKPRVLMHVYDAGEQDGRGPVAQYVCGRCEHRTDWIDTPPGPRGGFSQHRTKPCPKCNEPEEDARP